MYNKRVSANSEVVPVFFGGTEVKALELKRDLAAASPQPRLTERYGENDDRSIGLSAGLTYSKSDRRS